MAISDIITICLRIRNLPYIKPTSGIAWFKYIHVAVTDDKERAATHIKATIAGWGLLFFLAHSGVVSKGYCWNRSSMVI